MGAMGIGRISQQGASWRVGPPRWRAQIQYPIPTEDGLMTVMGIGRMTVQPVFPLGLQLHRGFGRSDSLGLAAACGQPELFRHLNLWPRSRIIPIRPVPILS